MALKNHGAFAMTTVGML